VANDRTIAIWASAYSDVGLGHLVRCVAFAQAWSSYGETIFFGHFQTHLSRELILKDVGTKIVDLDKNASILNSLDLIEQYCAPEAWILCDDYKITSSELLEVRKAGFKVILLDDFVDREKWGLVDVVVTSAELDLGELAAPPGAQLPVIFSGAKYRFVRQEFSKIANPSIKKHDLCAFNVLVCFGGTDSSGFTELVMELLSEILSETDKVQVIVGPMNPRSKYIQKLADQIPQAVDIWQSPLRVEKLLMEADLSIVSASGIAWESLAVNTPTLAVATTENQRMSLLSLRNIDLAEVLDSIGSTKKRALRESITLALEFRTANKENSNFDGAGASRIAEVLAGMYGEGFSESQVTLRPMETEDSPQVYQISNNATVRKQAFNCKYIRYSEHVRWFKNKLSDPKSLSYVVEVGGLILGFIHYSQIDSYADIDIAVHPVFRRRGVGKLMLQKTLNNAIIKMKCSALAALVLEGNKPSINMFEMCGFIRSGVSILHGKKAIKLILPAWSDEN